MLILYSPTSEYLASIAKCRNTKITKTKLEAAIMRSSQARCCELSAKLFRLPHELRDIIYTYLVGQ
jgi:hypothetical protein